ncbi:MAG: hypothetical protein K2L76_06355 [Muribaculaceae bacterium]|nr:hypothetical protein [Muribaculaceae bacterium]
MKISMPSNEKAVDMYFSFLLEHENEARYSRKGPGKRVGDYDEQAYGCRRAGYGFVLAGVRRNGGDMCMRMT